MLVLVLLAAIGLSIILQFVAIRLVSAIYFLLLIQLFSFPFWMTCVVWLAARSGRTDWSTWTVPLAIIAAPNLIGLLIGVFAMTNLSISDIIHSLWATTIRSNLLTYLLLAFLFRTTTLHLRPVEVATLPNRLTIRSILLLTSAVAVVLSIDLLVNQRASTQMKAMYPQSRYLVHFLSQLSTALVWFSVAWLFLARNPKRWIGVVGLIVYVMSLGVYMLVIAPLVTNQGPFPPGAKMPVFGPFYFASMFAVSVFHVLVVFLCVGMMHVAGYRWDIRRRLQENAVDFETRMDGTPPVLGSRIEINPEPPELPVA